MKAKQKSMSPVEQVLAILVLLVVGLVVTAFVGGFVNDHWIVSNGQEICKCVMAIIGAILMWVIMIDFSIERILKLE